MSWQFNYFAFPPLVGLIICAYFLLTRWRQRTLLSDRIFLLTCLADLWLCGAYTIHLLSATPAVMYFTLHLAFSAYYFVTATMFLFLLVHGGRERFVTRRNVLLLFVIPVFQLMIRFIGDYHRWLWSDVIVTTVGDLKFMRAVFAYTPVWGICIAYLYGLGFAMFLVSITSLLHNQPVFRQQGWMALAIIMTAATSSGLELLGLSPLPFLELILWGFSFSTVIVIWAHLRYQLLDLAPAAHDEVIRSIADAVFVVNAHQRVIEANQAASKLLQRELTSIIGQPVAVLFSHFGPRVQHCLGVQETAEKLIIGEGANPCYFDLRVSPLRNQPGEYKGWVILLRDITRSTKIEQQVAALAREQEQSQLLRRFIDDVSHDLSTPLTTLVMSAPLAKRSLEQLQQKLARLPTDSTLPAPELRQLQQISRTLSDHHERMNISIQRLQQLVSGMLEMMRLDQQLELHRQLCSLDQLITESMPLYSRLANERKIQLTFMSAPQVPALWLDKREFQRALQHLVRNALEYTAPAGQVVIRTGCHNQQVFCEVQDNGSGIAAADLPRIFDRFYRGDKARSAQTGGAGLGLTIAKKIIEAHQGNIAVESTLGVGSTFRLYLPVAAPEAQGAQ